VLLQLEGGRLAMGCDCAYAAGGELCKHLWATIRAADAEGHFATARSARRLALHLIVPDDLRFDGGGDDDPDAGRAWRAPAVLLPRRVQRTGVSAWADALATIGRHMHERAGPPAIRRWPAGLELLYVVDVARTLQDERVAVETWARRPKANGEPGAPRPRAIAPHEVEELPDAADRRMLGLLHGPPTPWAYAYGAAGAQFRLPRATNDALLPFLCQTGRCHLRLPDAPHPETTALAWDAGEPWRLVLAAQQQSGTGDYVVEGVLRRPDEQMPLAEPVMLLSGGFVFERARVARLDDAGVFPWIARLRASGPLVIPRDDGARFAAALAALPVLPDLDLPPALRFETVAGEAHPCLRLADRVPQLFDRQRHTLSATLSFDYGTAASVAHGAPGDAVYDRTTNRRIARDPAVERAAFERLLALGLRPVARTHAESAPETFTLAPGRVPEVVRALVADGWRVDAQGRRYRQATSTALDVSSGIDWFDVRGQVAFGDESAELPALLEALRRGDGVVELGDGSLGLVPEDWLERLGAFAGFGTRNGGRLRFRQNQIGIIDALLAAVPEASFDETVARARAAFERFEGVEPRDPPASFHGTLRPYQRDGLGWFAFLERFRFGGCLADDMGLGKTVQVLALLAGERERRAAGRGCRRAPSLIVVPRSLLFNWRQEAARFAPALRVLEHAGGGRRREPERFAEHDVVLTTYGTLRRDIAHLKDVRFAWAILDEAQAIKNAGTAAAKAARLLTAEHRLALSGTPIENHVGELWSLFEFLNPGMLGSASAFAAARGGARDLDDAGRRRLARAIRPFVLRRTKEQVARELPPRSEQTIYAELDRPERRLYDELRDHYRRALLPHVGRDGFCRKKIQVLEALLRLRQAACHPGLLDRARRHEPSAKLEILLDQLAQVRDEGHKALVFSQFTSLLAIVRDRLDRAGAPYVYLDGRTRDRAACVERFQNDAGCPLFLVSLKAGGVGLNLTAAEYVYLLDPWWNPAVEAQAIDRTHRIGQTRRVFAYRLIARDTVEEKVLELQRAKRGLADALIGADAALIRDLSREDLELLLS
jgi:superfamily II DNA or RNA helicase